MVIVFTYTIIFGNCNLCTKLGWSDFSTKLGTSDCRLTFVKDVYLIVQYVVFI